MRFTRTFAISALTALMLTGMSAPAAFAKDACPGKSCERPSIGQQDPTKPGKPDKPTKPGKQATSSISTVLDLPEMVVERLLETGKPVLWSEIVQLPDGRWVDVMHIAYPSMIPGWKPLASVVSEPVEP